MAAGKTFLPFPQSSVLALLGLKGNPGKDFLLVEHTFRSPTDLTDDKVSP